jgi:type IV pilus assembly protein PilB
MFRKEFAELITNAGMATLKTIRPLLSNTDENDVTEFELLKFDGFHPLNFAKEHAKTWGMNFVDLSNAQVQPAILKSIKRSTIIKYRIIPIQKNQSKLVLATFDPSIKNKEKEILNLLRVHVDIIITPLDAWKRIFEEIEMSFEELMSSIREVHSDKKNNEKELKESDIGQDIISLVNKVLVEAYIKKASDIHVEPYEKAFRMRLRIDGNLIELARPSPALKDAIISRFKIMAKMDISERRLPQDGRIKLMVGGKPIDYRVSSLPCLYGEKIVLRLLDQSNLQLDMTKLGFEKKQLDVFHNGISKPYGMVLVTGPTGSGKTTTLYSGLAELNKVNKNISTAEDPVEFNLEGINQVNVKKDIGLTFASTLKSFLRQDPDIIMVGEIRDFETGEIAVEAALTGHLVLSTLHTNDAPATITRLLNMGIEPFLVTASLNIVVAQRLARKICVNCKKPHPVPVESLVAAGIAPSSAPKVKTFKGQGCEVCSGTGYKGRVAVYEVLAMSPKLRELVLKHASSDEIKKQAIKEGMKTLRMSALTKVAQGLTTLEEACSVSAEDDL